MFTVEANLVGAVEDILARDLVASLAEAAGDSLVEVAASLVVAVVPSPVGALPTLLRLLPALLLTIELLRATIVALGIRTILIGAWLTFQTFPIKHYNPSNTRHQRPKDIPTTLANVVHTTHTKGKTWH